MKDLTDEQLNIAICEWRGWHTSYVEPEIGIKGGDMWLDPTGGLHYSLPSHITGPEALGNMHEAEKGLTDEQRGEYMKLLGALDNQCVSDAWEAACAPARQRAIALLRVGQTGDV